MFNILWNIFTFIIAIGVLIAFHEFGHFWVARRLGIKVLRFSIGFGKPLWRRVSKKGTEFVVAAFPLGGYVKMLDEMEGEVAPEDLPLTFNQQSIWKRMLVVCAGPVFNIIFAIMAYWLMFVIGITGLAPIIGQVKANSIAAQADLQKGDEILKVDNKSVYNWDNVTYTVIARLGDSGTIQFTVKNPQTGLVSHKNLQLDNWKTNVKKIHPIISLGILPFRPSIPAVIGDVIANSPAAKAGLQKNDRIVSIDGKKVNHWQQMSEMFTKRADKKTAITIVRDDKTLSLNITPMAKTMSGEKVGQIGIQSGKTQVAKRFLRVQNYSWWAAIGPALIKTWTVTKLTFILLGKLVLGKVSVQSISGPIGIAHGAGMTASMGISYFLDFLALISISLGIINILPIPVLDGGHLLYYVIELVRGKPLSIKAQAFGIKMGLLLLVGLMVLAVFNDLNRIFT